MGERYVVLATGEREDVKRYTRYAGLLFSLIAVLALVGCGARGGGAQGGGGEGGNYTIKFSHVVAPDTPKGLAAEKFKELAEEKCGDQLKVDIFPNSQLYGDEDELQALQGGSVQMLAPATAKFTTIAPAVQVLDLPFIFDSVEDIPEVVSKDSQVGQAIYNNQDLASKNVKVLGLWDNGLKQLSSNREMRAPEDLSGLKMRIQPSDVLRSQFAAWGASTTPMAFGEVFNALQQGVIDGQENPYSNIYSQKMHTVQDYITESNHGYIGYVLTINNDFFESLPDDVKQCVTEAADESTAYNREIAAQKNQEDRQKILDEGTTQIIELSDAERQAFKDAVVPAVWDEYAEVIGPDVIEALKERKNQ